MQYIEPDWKRSSLERMLLAAVEEFEAKEQSATYPALRRRIPEDVASRTWLGKEAILSGLAALTEAGYLDYTSQGGWVTSARWHFWRNIFRGEAPSP